jgi:beta-galactosidase
VDQVTAWYGAISAAHTGIDVILPGVDLSNYKIVFVPYPYVMAEEQAERLRKFVQAGGVLVAGFRLGAKTSSSQIVRTPLPGLLRDVMGVTVEDYVPIYVQGQGVKFASTLAGPDAEVNLWADLLKPESAEALGTYSSGSMAGKTAISMNNFGKGKAVYIGADLNAAGLSRVLRSLAASAGVQQASEPPAGIELTVRTDGKKQWMFLLNHTADSQTVELSGNFKDLLTGEAQSGQVSVAGYAVRVLQAA